MEVRYIITPEEAQYMEQTKGHFSKKMAEWAVSMMEKKDPSGSMRRITPFSMDEVEDIIKPYKQDIPDECIYDCYYLANMAKADYEKSLPTKDMIGMYVKETVCDPDGDSTSVLACFRAKMDNKGVPIFWERMI